MGLGGGGAEILGLQTTLQVKVGRLLQLHCSLALFSSEILNMRCKGCGLRGKQVLLHFLRILRIVRSRDDFINMLFSLQCQLSVFLSLRSPSSPSSNFTPCPMISVILPSFLSLIAVRLPWTGCTNLCLPAGTGVC